MPPKWLEYIQELKKVSEARKTATPLVKYYGPTMGKTTAVKYNPLLVDFDDIIRQPSKDILKKYGFDSKFHNEKLSPKEFEMLFKENIWVCYQ